MSFFSDLLGKTSANNATALGKRNEGRITEGYANADQYSKQGYDAAQGRFQPFATQGQKGFGAYYDAMGINGGDAQQKQFQSFQASPFLAYARQSADAPLNALFRKYNAQGSGNSGAAQYAVARAAGDRAQGDVQNYLAALQGMGQQGLGIAGQQAGLDQSYYGGMADRAVNRMMALNGNDVNATQAASNARMAGANNLLSGIGTLAASAGQMAMGMPPTALGNLGNGGGTGGRSAPIGSSYQPGKGYASGGGYEADPRRPWA